MTSPAVAPAMLTAHHDCEFREVLDRVGDKWSLLVIAMLEQRPTARARFSELKRSIPGISQRMLTATLRSLERDGLLTRHIYAEVPPRVEYTLTPLGKQFMQPVRGLLRGISLYGRPRMNIRLGRIHQRRSIPGSIPVVRGARCCPWRQRALRRCGIHRHTLHVT